MLEPLRKSWTLFRSHFLQLVISFCVTAVPLQLLIVFSPKRPGWQLFLAYLFVAAFLTSASVNVILVGKLETNESIKYGEVLRKSRENLVGILSFSIVLYFFLVVVLYLLSYFLNFLLSLTLLLVPVFTAYALPEITLNEEGLVKGLRRGIILSWDNLLSTAALSLIPGALVVYLWFNGWWMLAWCFIIPFLVVVFTVKFQQLDRAQKTQLEEEK
ncbi:MAG: hypothetical protein ACOC86_02925 [Candidatus Bipolaricaulota bacterium]